MQENRLKIKNLANNKIKSNIDNNLKFKKDKQKNLIIKNIFKNSDQGK